MRGYKRRRDRERWSEKYRAKKAREGMTRSDVKEGRVGEGEVEGWKEREGREGDGGRDGGTKGEREGEMEMERGLSF